MPRARQSPGPDLQGEPRADRAIGRGGRGQTQAFAAALRRSFHHAAMNTSRTVSRRRALRLWLAGQATILVGAAAMSWTHSFIPMALAGSAALMLTLPLVKALATGRRIRG
jgi:hypothetical protein